MSGFDEVRCLSLSLYLIENLDVFLPRAADENPSMRNLLCHTLQVNGFKARTATCTVINFRPNLEGLLGSRFASRTNAGLALAGRSAARILSTPPATLPGEPGAYSSSTREYLREVSL
jgi:hypothetical protein